MAQAIMSLECVVLMHAAKLYIATVCESKEPSGQSFFHVTDSGDASASSLTLLTPPTSLQRFKFLANYIQSSQLTTAGASSCISERDAIAAIYAQQLYS
jgi:hypothetical protein